MNTSLFVLALLDGTTQAALLFLVALGLTLIFGVMRILNVAHGSFYAFGGYAAAKLGDVMANGESIPLSLLALVLGALAMGVLLGVIIETGLIRRILNIDPVMQLLATFAVFMIMEDLQRMIWGASPVSVTHAVDAMGTLKVGVVTYTAYQLLLLPAAAVAVFLGLRWSLGHTRFGRQIMAVTHHREVASAMGINAKRRRPDHLLPRRRDGHLGWRTRIADHVAGARHRRRHDGSLVCGGCRGRLGPDHGDRDRCTVDRHGQSLRGLPAA